jgi:hypothetical protein
MRVRAAAAATALFATAFAAVAAFGHQPAVKHSPGSAPPAASDSYGGGGYDQGGGFDPGSGGYDQGGGSDQGGGPAPMTSRQS